VSQAVSEMEKRRVSRQLYDDLGQRLSVLKLDMDWLEKSLPDADKLCPSRVAQMQGLLDNIISRTKTIASSLRPPLLDDFGLLPAINWIAESFQKKTSVACHVEAINVVVPPGDPIESAVFRVVQEGLLNIERHARARNANVTLRQSRQQLEVLIQDDGVGMSRECKDKADCFGLIAMRERIYTLGGSVNIGNARPCGVAIHVTIPFPTVSLAANST
jgi:signal transduction histidine kinase